MKNTRDPMYRGTEIKCNGPIDALPESSFQKFIFSKTEMSERLFSPLLTTHFSFETPPGLLRGDSERKILKKKVVHLLFWFLLLFKESCRGRWCSGCLEPSQYCLLMLF